MNAMAKVMAESSKTRPDIEKILGLDEPPASSWFQRRRSTFIVVVLLAVGLAALLLWTMAGSKGSPEYVTKPVTRDDITVFVSATGTVQPINQVDVSSEQSGTVRKVYVDFNSQVTKDQSLAELDTDKLQATVDSARAKLLAAKSKVKEAEATVTETELELQRKQNLVERRISSAQDLDTAKAAYDRAVASLDSAKADVAAAEADLKLDETNLSKAIITSPINGIVLSRDIEPGQTVAASLEAPTLFTLAEDLSQMEVQVDVDEADVGQVKEKQNATFTVDAYPERTFAARIRSLTMTKMVFDDGFEIGHPGEEDFTATAESVQWMGKDGTDSDPKIGIMNPAVDPHLGSAFQSTHRHQVGAVAIVVYKCIIGNHLFAECPFQLLPGQRSVGSQGDDDADISMGNADLAEAVQQHLQDRFFR